MNKIFTGKNKILLVNNVEKSTIPKIRFFLFVHDLIVKEKVIMQNFVGSRRYRNLCE